MSPNRRVPLSGWTNHMTDVQAVYDDKFCPRTKVVVVGMWGVVVLMAQAGLYHVSDSTFGVIK